MRPIPPLANALFAAAALASLPASQVTTSEAEGPVVPFEEMAANFLAARGLSEAEPADVDLDELLAREFARADLGLYEVWIPAATLADVDVVEDLQSICSELVAAQATFLEWVAPAGLDQEAGLEALEVVADWVDGWKRRQLGRAADSETPDLAEVTNPKQREADAVRVFADYMRSGAPLGLERSEPIAARILLMPTRKHFIEFVCFAGWRFPDWKGVYWDKSLDQWLGCRIMQTQVIAMQSMNQTNERDRETNYLEGLSLNARNPTGLPQNVVHFATQALLDNYYGDSMPPYLSTGLAMNMVVDTFGEVATRIEGDLRARFTNATSAFIPGGASGGGALPPMDASSRWRAKQGKGHFLELRKRAQKEGASNLRKTRETTHFELEADEGRAKTTISAPFLGSAAEGRDSPAEEFMGDYQEFFRAYKCAFTHWLQTVGTGRKKTSRVAFATLLVGLGELGDGDFEALLSEAYDLPLSGRPCDESTLEGRFLEWLTKQ